MDDDGGKEADGLAETLVDAHEAVLVLDGENAVVAYELKVGNEIAPVAFAVAEADGAEYPGAVDLVAVVLGVKHAVLGGVVGIDLGVLGTQGRAQNEISVIK